MPQTMPTALRFTKSASPFFPDSCAGSAELKLDYAIGENRELALVIGDSGLGKTTVLRRCAEKAAIAGDAVVDVFFPQLDANQLIAFIDGELGTPETLVRPDRQTSLRHIANRAGQLAQRNRAIILAIDDAHLLTDRGAWETLQSLLNLRDRANVRMTLLLAGQKSLLANLSGCPALAQRVGITAVLTSLNLQQTREYLRWQTRRMGKGKAICEASVIERLHEQTGGNPRSLTRMVEMALLLAKADGRETVSLDDLASLVGEIGLSRCAA